MFGISQSDILQKKSSQSPSLTRPSIASSLARTKIAAISRPMSCPTTQYTTSTRPALAIQLVNSIRMETLCPPLKLRVAFPATTGATITAATAVTAAVAADVARVLYVVATLAAVDALVLVKCPSGDISWAGQYGCFALRCSRFFSAV